MVNNDKRITGQLPQNKQRYFRYFITTKPAISIGADD